MPRPHDGDRPHRLLVAADAARNDDLLRSLEAAGYELERAADLQQSLAAVRARHPDLVLADMGPAGAGGIELCRGIRGMPEAAGTPVLMLLGPEDMGSLGEAREAGASDFLQTGAHPTLVEHRIVRAIECCGALLGISAAHELCARAEPQTGTLSAGEIVSHIEGAIARAKMLDRKLAVLSVSIDCELFAQGVPLSPENDARVSAQQTAELREAALHFEQRESSSHAQGDIRIASIDATRAVLVLPALGRVQDAAKLGARVRAAMTKPLETDGRRSDRTVNVGISTYPADGVSAEELLECAASAAYVARQEGRNNLRFHNSSMNRWSFERLTLEQNLREALERNELVVHYQPKMDIPSRRIVGMEALVRWNHPKLGMISPAQFIPLAEETGLIVPIGEWVLATACRQNKEWQDLGMQPIHMAVNLSQVQFRQPDLFETVRSTLEEAHLSPEWLELELTESMLMQDVKSTLQSLQKLKDAGIRLSIDDFGTGYSSLSYLKRFPIDTLKIDRSFVREVTANADDAAIVTSIILMGHSLKLNIVAEGVETDSQLSFLRVLQCNEIQGYLISPPVPATKAEKFLIGGRR